MPWLYHNELQRLLVIPLRLPGNRWRCTVARWVFSCVLWTEPGSLFLSDTGKCFKSTCRGVLLLKYTLIQPIKLQKRPISMIGFRGTYFRSRLSLWSHVSLLSLFSLQWKKKHHTQRNIYICFNLTFSPCDFLNSNTQLWSRTRLKRSLHIVRPKLQVKTHQRHFWSPLKQPGCFHVVWFSSQSSRNNTVVMTLCQQHQGRESGAGSAH